MNDEAQAAQAAAVEGAKTGARITSEAEANADVGAGKSIPVIDKTLSIVNELRNHRGREWGTGGSSLVSAVPGTPAYDFKIKLEQLTGQTFLTEVEKMRGLGTLTEQEGRRLSSAAAALDAAQSEPEFLRQLDIFQSELEAARARHQQRLTKREAPGASTKPARPAPPINTAKPVLYRQYEAALKRAAGNQQQIDAITARARQMGLIK
jgi:hypothetical protein